MDRNILVNQISDNIDKMLDEYNGYVSSTNALDEFNHYLSSTLSAVIAVSIMNMVQQLHHDDPIVIGDMADEAMRMMLILRDIKEAVKDDTEKFNEYDKLFRKVRNSTISYIRFCLNVGDNEDLMKRAFPNEEERSVYHAWANEVRALWSPEINDDGESKFKYDFKIKEGLL